MHDVFQFTEEVAEVSWESIEDENSLRDKETDDPLAV